MFTSIIKIKNWLDQMNITGYTIHEDFVVDVKGDVKIANKNLSFIPVKFGKVSGRFHCDKNPLQSLKGCPDEVGTDFKCSDLHLCDYEFLPQEITGKFHHPAYPELNILKCSSLIDVRYALEQAALQAELDKISPSEYSMTKQKNSFF